MERSPKRLGGDLLALPHRVAVAGFAAGTRPLADRVGSAFPLVNRWDYDRILTAAKSAEFLAAPETDAVVQLLSVDSTVVRAHQHAAGAGKTLAPEGRLDDLRGHGGTVELHESAGRTG